MLLIALIHPYVVRLSVNLFSNARNARTEICKTVDSKVQISHNHHHHYTTTLLLLLLVLLLLLLLLLSLLIIIIIINPIIIIIIIIIGLYHVMWWNG